MQDFNTDYRQQWLDARGELLDQIQHFARNVRHPALDAGYELKTPSYSSAQFTVFMQAAGRVVAEYIENIPPPKPDTALPLKSFGVPRKKSGHADFQEDVLSAPVIWPNLEQFAEFRKNNLSSSVLPGYRVVERELASHRQCATLRTGIVQTPIYYVARAMMGSFIKAACDIAKSDYRAPGDDTRRYEIYQDAVLVTRMAANNAGFSLALGN